MSRYRLGKGLLYDGVGLLIRCLTAVFKLIMRVVFFPVELIGVIASVVGYEPTGRTKCFTDGHNKEYDMGGRGYRWRCNRCGKDHWDYPRLRE